MTVALKWPDLLHEGVHATTHRLGVFSDRRADEGVAYATQYIDEATGPFTVVENWIVAGNLRWLKQAWPNAWRKMNNVLSKQGKVVPAFGWSYTFIVDATDVSRAEKTLGFNISCEKLASCYNQWIAWLHGEYCVKLTCGFKERTDEIALDFTLAEVFLK